MLMPGRKYSIANTNYRYGFNGKELDKETSSTTTYDYGFRIYSPGLGRFLSVDPLTRKFPWYTPYQFAGNKPIAALDLDGLEDIVFHDIDVAKRVAKVDINKIGLLITTGNNKVHQGQLVNSATINSLYQKGNTTLYIDKLPKEDASVQFKFISEKKYNKGDGYKIEVAYNVSTQNSTDLRATVAVTNTNQNLYSIMAVPFDAKQTYLSEGTQLNNFSNSDGNIVAAGVLGGSYLWLNPDYFGATPKYTTNEGQEKYTFQLSGSETIVHELGHNMIPSSNHDANNSGNPNYPGKGLMSNKSGNVYPTQDDTKNIIKENLNKIRIEKKT